MIEVEDNVRAAAFYAEVRGAVEAALAREQHRLARRTDHLQSLAGVAAALGVLGTIYGLVHSRSGMCCMGSCEFLLLAALSETLWCAVFGLGLGMTCLAARALLRERTRALLDDLVAASAEAVALLARNAGPARRRGADPTPEPWRPPRPAAPSAGAALGRDEL